MPEGSSHVGKNTLPLRLHIPTPQHRPGEAADFSAIIFPLPGTAPRPPVDARVRGLDLALRDRSGLFDPGVS